jgi:hypothetical protein
LKSHGETARAATTEQQCSAKKAGNAKPRSHEQLMLGAFG